jgi:DNA-binding response OmpR family regulator
MRGDAVAGDIEPAGRLLLVEDDRTLGPMLVEILSEFYRVQHAVDGQQGLHAALTRPFDVLVVDRGLPAIEGVDLVRRLRVSGVLVPALILTAWGTLTDRVQGLDAGAEDYLVKPFEIDELLARLRALLRRNVDAAETVDLGRRSYRVADRTVVNGDTPTVELSSAEGRLLEVLARRPQQVFTRTELLALVFDPADGPGSVDTYVYYLRRKLGREAIRTIYGLGYRWGSA